MAQLLVPTVWNEPLSQSCTVTKKYLYLPSKGLAAQQLLPQFGFHRHISAQWPLCAYASLSSLIVQGPHGVFTY